MAAQILLSIDGRDGVDVTQDRESHLHVSDVATLVPGSAGRAGVNAPPANRGEHAGLLQARLSHSRVREGGITIKAIEQRGSRQIAADTEIPPHGRVHFSAVGGGGEPGRQGGNGGDGATGQPGTNATRTVDAGVGGEGGQGGIAGLGSDGAAGGNGGFIQLVVSEDELEILYSVSCDIAGGQGGDAGHNGEPGAGGKGGGGGAPLIWEDTIDTIYKCTSNCIGQSTEVAIIGNQRDPTMEMFQRFREEATRRSPLGTTIAMALTATTAPRPRHGGALDSQGVCKCRGGSGNCIGCRSVPIYRTFSRPGADSGRDGPSGNRQLASPAQGASGDPGKLSIVVQRRSGQVSEGSSIFKLALVSFDVEDANSDGIFEPGEDIFIRRIQVQNSGGVLSPLRPIECKLSRSSSILSASQHGAVTHLPTSIPAGSVKVAPGGLRAKLALPSTSLLQATVPYQRTESLSLNAVMPWTNLPIENFDLEKSITVQFPVEFREIKTPKSITPGCGSIVEWEIANKSVRHFGRSTGYNRVARVIIEIHNNKAELVSQTQSPSRRALVTVPFIEPQGVTKMSHSIQVKPHTAAYSDLVVSFELYISKPDDTDLTSEPDLSEMQLVETRQATVQVAPGYVSSKADDVLLVINSANKKREIEAIVDLFESELGLQTNTWNLSIYGGLLAQDSSCPEEVESVMSDFEGKAVILLGNKFNLGSQKDITVTQLCEPLSIRTAIQQRTSCLFFGSVISDKSQSVFNSLFRPVEGQAMQLVDSLPGTSKHKTFESVIKSLLESSADFERTCLVDVRKTRFKSKDKNMRCAAEEMASLLLSQVPQHHFYICQISGKDADNGVDGQLLIQRGLRRAAQIRATQTDLLRMVDPSSSADLNSGGLSRQGTRLKRNPKKLSPFDKFALIGALPVARRLNFLDQTDRSMPQELTELIEVSIEQQIDTEIQGLMELAVRINLKGEPRTKMLRDCLPITTSLVDHYSKSAHPSNEIRRIVAHCFASCRPQTTGKVVSQALSSLANRGRLVEKFLTDSLGSLKKLGLEDASSPSQRRVSSALEGRVNEATGQGSHFQKLASYGPSQSLRTNDVLTVEQWNDAATRTKMMEDEVISIFDQFHKELDTYGPEQTVQSVSVE